MTGRRKRTLRLRSARTRGEGYVEYAIVLSLIMICSIVGLLTAGSETIRKIQYAHGICHGCPPPSHDSSPPPAHSGGSYGDPSAAPSDPPSDASDSSSASSPSPAPADGNNKPDAPPPPSPPGGTPLGDPAANNTAATMGVFSKIWGWFTGLVA